MSDISNQIEESRENLLDMSLRNRLLNFKEYKRSTAKIVDEVPAEIYHRLVVSRNKMSFLPKGEYLDKRELEVLSEDEAVEVNEDGGKVCLVCEEGDAEFFDEEKLVEHLKSEHEAMLESVEDPVEEMDDIWELPDLEEEKEDRHVDGYLQTPHEESNLQKRLYNIAKKSESMMEDAGYNALHLAVGFLEWTESTSQDSYNRAPLILIPVTLEREGVRSGFKLQWSEEEVTGNLSLNLKLSEQGFELPEFERTEDKEGVREYLKAVEERIGDNQDWKVTPDIHLGFFDFTKFIMYQDLDPENWESSGGPSEHHIIRSILGSEDALEDPGSFEEEDIDRELSPEEVHHVKDADPSQISVIEDAKRGRNLVIEGPPGTGKSQTIVNMIAEFLADDKKVLFVSEKMAALNVVKDRLDSVGIGDFCLELHSEKASKSEFLNELERITKLDSYNPNIPDEGFRRLENKRRKLNQYADALGTPFGELNRTPYELYGRREETNRHFEKKDKEFPRINIDGAESLSPDKYEKAKSEVEELSSRLKPVYPIRDNTWYGCEPGKMLPGDREDIEEGLGNAIEALEDLQKENRLISDRYGVEPARDVNSFEASVESIPILYEGEAVGEEILLNRSWEEKDRRSDVEELINKVELLQESLNDVGERISPLPEGSKEDISKYRDIQSSFDKYFGGSWHNIDASSSRGELKDYSRRVIDRVEESRKAEKKIRENFHTEKADNLNSFRDSIRGSKLLNRDWSIDGDPLQRIKRIRESSKIEDIIQNLRDRKRLKQNVEDRTNRERVDIEIPELLTRYRVLRTSYTRFFRPEWYELKGEISSIYMGDVPEENEMVIEDLESLIEIDTIEENIREFNEEGSQLFGDIWRGINTEPDRLEEFYDWMENLHRELENGSITKDSIDLALEGSTHDGGEVIVEADEAAGSLEDAFDGIRSAGFNERYVYNSSFEEMSFGSVVSTISTLQDILDVYTDSIPENASSIEEDLERVIEIGENRRHLDNSENTAKEFFGTLWEGEDSDVDRLREFSGWVVDFREEINNGRLTEESVTAVSSGVSEKEITKKIDECETIVEELEREMLSLSERLEMNPHTVFGGGIREIPLESFLSTLYNLKEGTGELERWSQFDYARKRVLDTIAAPIVEMVNRDELDPEDLLPCFEGSVADSLLRTILEERPVLSQFDKELHEDRIDSFQELDRKSIEINRKRVLSKLVENTPRLMQGSSKSSPAGSLLHEFGKKRRHKPIRILLQEAGGLIQDMKPCFMMSPLSVAKYLDPGTLEFDVVIFDEASQVKPEDALGTIVRGNQLILFGDTKQLPPTSFFDHIVDNQESEDEWDFRMQDVESILDLCRSSLPAKRLKWHYRSKHESLIAVSNQEFYDNDLVVYPSPVQESEHLGLEFRHLPDTVYDRGGSSVNRQEARKVAEAAVEHYRNNPSKSLGIGTFSQAQQKAILEEVERLRKENPEMDKYFSSGNEERFFVKNLERIQGDERDVIFISVGYGHDSDGKFHHTFGPLNSSGGWRRLNVLITRARERCVVFSNFTADAIDPSATSSRGVKSLKIFLDYAENGNLDSVTDAGTDPDSPFERSVIEFLREEGYEVHPQVGSAGFRIDIGIRDPENPGRYVLGIECDGASYHSSPVARARDRQRQEVLEDRGWELYRIWSTDWYRNRENAKKNLISEVEKAISRGHLSISSETDSSSGVGTETDGGDEDETPLLDEVEKDNQGASYIEELSVPYERYSNFHVILTDPNPRRIASHIEDIVDKEGPIHEGLLRKRLVQNSDVSRGGSKIYESIEESLLYTKSAINKRGEFIDSESNSVEVRRRDGMELESEWIPETEVQKGVEKILKSQSETSREDLIEQTSRLLGFSRTGKSISQRISEVIDEMLASGDLEEEDGRIHLNE